MVTLITKAWDNGAWYVLASIVLVSGSRIGPHVLDLPEETDDAGLEAAVLSLYV